MPSDEKFPMSAGTSAVLTERAFDGRAWHHHVAVLIDEGRIRALAPAGEIPDGVARRQLPEGSFIAPGFIDLQVNGGGGLLFNDHPTPECMWAIARAHRSYGTTACLPTFITDTREQMQAAVRAARRAVGKEGVIGVHLEGPFISPARPGIHRPDRIAGATEADIEWLSDLREAGRSLVTLAPECVPRGFVRSLAAKGILVSAGHSEASADDVLHAIDEGLSGVTHLYNAMPPLSGRAPGIVGAALCDRRLTAGLIVDGFHVDPVAVRAAFVAKGVDRIALVTDAMPSVGAELTQFSLMGRTIMVNDGRLTGIDGTLAGAHLDLSSAVRNAVTLAKLPLEEALRAASLTPAQFLGVEHERGTLAPGTRADLVALTSDLQVLATWVGGVEYRGACRDVLPVNWDRE